MVYRNLSRVTKNYYGVEFKPGEMHDVPGYVNDPKFVRMFGVVLTEKPEESAASVESAPEQQTKKTKNKNPKEEVNTNGSDCDQ